MDIPGEIQIRLANEDDALPLSLLADQLGYPASTSEMTLRLKRILPDPRHAIFVAENGAPAGWIQVSIFDSLEGGQFAEIVGLVVTLGQRRSGIGSRLVARAEEWARENRCARVRVRTNVIRAEARSFYSELGYTLKKTQAVFDKRLE